MKLTKKQRDDIRGVITDWEFFGNSFHKLTGYEVRVVNCKYLKDIVKCDIELINHEDNEEERFNGVEYNLNDLKLYIERQKNI